MTFMQIKIKQVNIKATLMIAGVMASYNVSNAASSVASVNYTDTTIASVRIVDPENVDNYAPAQEAMAYGTGGQVCCYTLPQTWHQGLQVEVKTETEVPTSTPKAYQEHHTRSSHASTVVKTTRVSVPPYSPGQAQMIWVQILPHDQYRVIATDRTPNQPDFPSDVKGWPVPSVAFQHRLWENDVAETQKKLARATRSVQELHHMRESELKAYWKVWSQQQEVKSKNFFGYNDPRFLTFLNNVFYQNEAYAKERLRKLSTFEPK